MGVYEILPSVKTSLTDLFFQMKKMEAISENISNVENSPDENGNVYQKESVVFRKTGQSSPVPLYFKREMMDFLKSDVN